METKEIKYIEGVITKLVLKNEICTSSQKIWEKIETRCTDKEHNFFKTYKRAITWSIAACIIILLGSSLFLSNVKVYTVTENQDVHLPDNSLVTLRQHSYIKYNKITWLFRRTVEMAGNAKFTVVKGGKFSVLTQNGTISVLGTKFMIDEHDSFMHVSCLEGRVNVETEFGSKILNKGEQLLLDDNGIKVSLINPPLPEYYLFTNGLFKDIVKKIEDLYHVDIVGNEKYNSYLYSGAIPTGNINDALDLLLSSCGINYTLNGNQIVLDK